MRMRHRTTGAGAAAVAAPRAAVGDGSTLESEVTMTSEGSINDVEKRWRDPAAVRAAAKYVGIVVVLAFAAIAATAVSRSLVAGVLVPGILFVGGIGAFVRTIQVWRADGVWVIWQAAGWILLSLAVFFLGVPFGVR